MSHQPENDQIEPVQQTPTNPSRRKLAAGLGAGVAMTLSGRSALAVECFKPSAWASASHLSHRGDISKCTGRTRAQWAARNKDRLPGGNQIFSTVFPNGNGIIWRNTNQTKDYFDEVLDQNDNGNDAPRPNPISAEFVAAYLNVVDGRIPSTVMSTGDLKSMWNEWRNNGAVNGGYITVRNNIKLYTNDIVAYLQSLNRS